jgi:hypothetical protein
MHLDVVLHDVITPCRSDIRQLLGDAIGVWEKAITLRSRQQRHYPAGLQTASKQQLGWVWRGKGHGRADLLYSTR